MSLILIALTAPMTIFSPEQDELIAWLRRNRPLKWGRVPKGSVSLTIAEIDFLPPRLPPLHEIMDTSHWYCYGELRGSRKLRSAIRRRLKAKTGVTVNDAQLCLTPGVRAAFDYIANFYSEDVNEVVCIGSAIYEIYSNAAERNGMSIRLVPVPEQALEEMSQVNSRRRLFIFCNPGVPDGACFSPDVLAALATAAEKSGDILISDEVFSDFANSSDFRSMASFLDLGNSLIVLSSFTKNFGIGANRIGYLVSSDTTISNFLGGKPMMGLTPAMSSQEIAYLHLTHAEAWHEGIVSTVERNREVIRRELGNVADQIRLSGIDNTYVATFALPARYTQTEISQKASVHVWDTTERYIFDSTGEENTRQFRLAFAAPTFLIEHACEKLKQYFSRIGISAGI